MSLHERFEAEALPYMKMLYRTALRMTHRAEDAEDLVQETLLRAFAGFGRFEPGTNLRAWLFTILQRARVDAIRRQSRRPKVTELSEEGAAVAPAQEMRAVDRDRLEQAFAGLPEAYRTAVTLRDVEDLSYREIAEVLGVAQGTVMSRIHRGRSLLRQALDGGQP